jgi:hypothetical protein
MSLVHSGSGNVGLQRDRTQLIVHCVLCLERHHWPSQRPHRRVHPVNFYSTNLLTKTVVPKDDRDIAR